ncbi:1-phosphatidylinositol 4,5-bisphosphate phosphodiesterase beta-2 [Aplochiton taeniatus]
MNSRRYILEPPDVKDYLVKGDRFTKWSEDSTKTVTVTMKMDPKGFYVYWTNQSKETVFLDVATIRDTRAGKFAKLPKHPKVRNVFNLDFPDSKHLEKTLTIVSGLDMVNLTYHNFMAYKEKVTQNWAADILAIAYNPSRANACRQVYLDKMFIRISLHTNKDGKIPVKNIYKMFPADKKRVESALASAHLPKGKGDSMKTDVFTEAAFKTFLMHLCPRPEIYEIFTSYSAKAKPYMTKDSLAQFINEKQRDSRLNEALFPRLRPDQVKALIDKYEPVSSNANRGQISPEGLLFYLMGSETSVVILDRLAKCHDMSQPVPHYLIKSSHNTYLTAGQFSGVSSPEMYRQCLLSGCRCLELDCWKGKPPDEEPIITHGFTMTTEILFKDVIEAIAESAFKTSQYPVVLSFENHVDSVKQQEKMANYCKTIFGDALLTEPLEKYPLKPGVQIPSPSELMGKILIKNKKGNHAKPANQNTQKKPGTGAEPNPGPAEGEGAVEDIEEQEEPDDQDEEKMKTSDEGTAGQEVTAYEEMSAIVNYIQPNKFISFENSKKKNKSYGISSFVETKGEGMISKTAVEFVEYNKRQMSRIYPKGTRMDSSNYSPQPFWNAGCQFVALNYQTMDFPMQLNMALFEFNGRTGYLLKHDLLRRNDKKFDPYCDRIDTIVANTLTIKIYSGQFLSEKSVKTGVEVEVIGLPGDPKKKYRTKWSTTPNAINPVWNEEPFVFEKILLPDMAVLRLVVHEENGKFLGHRIVPVEALQSGFQHICLRSESNMPLTMPALFVHIEVKDYIPAAFADFTDALFNPTKGTEKTSKTYESSADYVSPYELPQVAQTLALQSATNELLATVTAEPEKEAVSSLPEPEQDGLGAPTDPDLAEPTPEPSPEEPNGGADPVPETLSDPPLSVDDAAPKEPETGEQSPVNESLPPDSPGTEEAAPNPDLETTPEPATEPEKDPTPCEDEKADQVVDNGALSDVAPSDEGPKEAVPSPVDDVPSPVDDVPSPEDDVPSPVEDVPSPDAGPESVSAGVAQVAEAPPPADDGEPPTVSSAELTQHKSFVKVTRRQEKDLKELEKKFSRKEEELLQKHGDALKALKKKSSLKKKEGGADEGAAGPKTEKAVEQKERMQLELRVLRVEQADQLKKKKELFATERLSKLLETAMERHSLEMRTLESDTKETKKKALSKRSSSDKAKLKKALSVEALDEGPPKDPESTEYSPQQESLLKRQAVTLDEIKALAHQLNQEALAEYEQKMRCMGTELREAVNSCVGVYFPGLVEQGGGETGAQGQNGGVYGDVFLG